MRTSTKILRRTILIELPLFLFLISGCISHKKISGVQQKIIFLNITPQEAYNLIKKTYLVYCKSGYRSRAAVNVMKKLYFKRVYNILGGINAWQRARLPLIIRGE